MTDKKQLTPEQKANASAKALKYGVLIYDATTHLAVSFLSTLIAWATAIGLGQWHIPFLPVWLGTFGALMALRHVGKTWGKAKSAGQLEAQLEAYKAAMLSMPAAAKANDAAEQFRNLLKQSADKGSGPYL